VGDDSEVVVHDAAHEAGPIAMAVGGRHVVAVVCTHGHNDHMTVTSELGEALDSPALVHPRDDMLCRIPTARPAADRAVHAGTHHRPRDPA
jgi:glyoxylase-like metal-dependent hydrolase (beta-lactamase superfamily II)